MIRMRHINPERAKMITARLIKTERARNDKHETNQTGKSRERYVRDKSNRKDTGMISTRLIKQERARNDKYETNQTRKSQK